MTRRMLLYLVNHLIIENIYFLFSDVLSFIRTCHNVFIEPIAFLVS